MEADFGGTDIFSALSSVIYYEEYKSNPDIPLNVFLLTDGEDEPSRIIDIVQKNTRPETRIYTLGIGQDCNQYLIKRVAEVGNGKHHFADNDDIDSKVIDLLEDSMTPYLKAIQLTTNVQQIHSIIPDPEQIINLRRNEELTIQVLFSSKQTNDNLKFEIKCFDPQLNKQLSHQCNVLLYNATYNEYFHKLSGHKLITLYENAQENNLDNVGIKFQYQNLTNLDIINTSIQYQILSSKTAFVGQVCKYEKEIVQEAEIQIGSLYSYVCLHCRSEVKQQQRDFKYLEIPNLSLKRISFEEFTKSSQPDGSFKLDGNIKLILKNVVHMVNKFSEQQSNTILALFYLELNFQDKKSSWKLILQKGIDYLKNQKLDYLNLKQQYFDKFQALLNG